MDKKCIFASLLTLPYIKKMRDEKDIIAELNEYSSLVNFLNVLIYLTEKNLNCSVNDLSNRNFRDLLNENELAFLFGLWMKNRHKKNPSKGNTRTIADKVHCLMDEYHLTFLKYFPKPGKFKDFHVKFRTNPESVKETIFYGPTGAYDYQFLNFLETKYSKDKLWLIENKNFNPKDAKSLYINLKSIFNYKLNAKKIGENHIELYSFKFNNFLFQRNPNFVKILDSFSSYETEILNQDFNDIGDLNQFKIKPVIKTKDSYIIPLPYLLSEAIYDSPFYWMIDDEKYRSKALKNRGDIAEYIVKEILSRKIETKFIFSGVEVKKVKTKTLTDLDVCIVKDNKMLIFQVKSKRLSQLSKNGDINSFQKDFKLAVQDAHKQATLPYDLILNNECYFQLKENRQKIEFGKIDEIYSACVVLDSYPSITTHTRLFFHDEKDITPITMSIFDLEILVKYLESFEKLFDYLKKRTINSKYLIANRELDYLSAYLKNLLNRKANSDVISFDPSFAQFFDSDYYYPLMRKYENKFPEQIKDIGRNDFCFCGSGVKFKKCCYNNVW